MSTYIDPTIPPHMQASLRENLPYPVDNVIKNPKVMGGLDHPNVIGWVDPKMADVMFLNKARDGRFPRNTGAHELEHMLQFNTKRYGYSYDRQVLDEIARHALRNNQKVPNIYDTLSGSANNEEFHRYLSALIGEPAAPYLGRAGDDWYNLKEQFAELSAIEQILKKDLTKDPMVRKHFFKDNESVINAYKATTGLRTNRLDPKDLDPMDSRHQNTRYPPKEKEKSVLERILGFIRK